MLAFMNVTLLWMILTLKVCLSEGQCIHNFNKTSCLDEVRCTGYVDVKTIDQYNVIWNFCHSFRITSPVYYGLQCLPMKLIYKEDEEGDHHEVPKFRSNDFSLTFSLIKFLDISNNNYVDFPLLAAMNNLKILDVSFNNLTAVNLSSRNQLLALEEIDISYNLIDDIVVNVNEYPFTNLIKLKMSHNEIIKLKDTIFSEFDKLQYLDLSYNKITTVTAITFEGIKNLLNLNMAHNKIKELNFFLFRFTKIQYIYLNNNQINSILLEDFKNLIQLQELDLSYNIISTIEPNVFDNMPFLSSVNLKNNLLKSLDQNLFLKSNSLKNIDLSLNELHVLPKNIFKGKEISFFDIRRNNLKGALMKGSFQGLTYITELDVSHQILASIEDYAFIGLGHLEVLLLNNNEIKNISQKSFTSLQNLKRLDISYNEIAVLNFDLDDLVKLEFLSVKENQIKSISISFFAVTNVINFLDISNNNISRLNANTFMGLRELVNLDISKNLLSNTLEGNTFEGLHALPILDISYTSLTMIKNNSFDHMISLHTLNMSHSTINELSFNTFINTENINVIDLSYNLLKTFNVNTTTLVNLSMLYLNHNLIDVVSPNFVFGLNRLSTINLSWNDIKVIDDEVFINLNRLSSVDLSYNKHIRFNVTLLKNTRNLQKLIVSGILNFIKFDETLELPITELDMSQSNINNISILRINTLQELHSLVMKNNKIKKLEVGSFSNLTKLDSLDLSFNDLEFIQPGVFKDNSYLSILNISHNHLTSLSYGIFRGLAYLSTLDLSYNELQDLQSERFYGIESLRTLILDFNKISKISVEEFSLYLSVLSIGGNSINCDNLLKLKSKSVVTSITAIKLDESNTENIDGVTCYGYVDHKHKENTGALNGNESILSDIRDILRNLSTKTVTNDRTMENNPDNTYLKNTEILIKSFNQSQNTFQNILHENNISNAILIDYFNQTNNNAYDIVREHNVTNNLLEKMLKIIVANKSATQIIPVPILKENGSNETILPYINKIRQAFENSLTIEKENILSEVSDRISVIVKKIDDMSKNKPLPVNNDTISELSIQNMRFLYTEICVSLILLIVLCFIGFIIYERIILTPRRRSFSTQQIANVLENSNL